MNIKNGIRLALAAWLLSPVAVSVAGEDRPAIAKVDLHAYGGYLTADVTASGLFPERITGTVESGLPAVVDLFFHLVGPGGRSVEKGVLSYSLEYDVWTGVYSVTGPDSVAHVPTLEAMQAMVEHMRSISLVPVERMEPHRVYFVQMSVAVSPLQGNQSREMDSWVKQNVESEQGSWHEQVLNVNELIERFFSGHDLQLRSPWYRTADFRLELLSPGAKENR